MLSSESRERLVSPQTGSQHHQQTGHDAKKSLKASEVYSEAKQQQRCDYRQSIRDVAAEDLIFLNETGVTLAMVLRYARAQRGQWAYAKQPKGWQKNLSLIGTIHFKAGFLAGISFTGAPQTMFFCGLSKRFCVLSYGPEQWS